MAKMLKVERLTEIENYLNKNKQCTVTQLAELLGITLETVRKDLDTLEKRGIIKRVHGGAYLIDSIDREVPINVRNEMFQKEKTELAIICAKQIIRGDNIALDSSTTSFYIAQQIKHLQINCTIITNSLEIIHYLQDEPYLNLIMIGGKFREISHSFIGPSAIDMIDNYVIDKFFISCSGISMELGLTDNNQNEGEVRKKFINQSNLNYLVVDHTKF
ncbi:MAG: DeoR/GlpR family DNA-binding transcription regulator, partial [Enterococcus sp.]|nr:DeoR/GlpR family DNA-binding transcription regulator [Enterococcus sp.]